jgi:hypothetical protein
MKKSFLILVCLVSFFFIASIGCTKKKNEAEKTVDTYFELIKQKNFAKAWDMLDQESQAIVGQETFINDARNVSLNAMNLKIKPSKMNAEETKAIIETEYTGQKVAMNDLPEAKITFWANKTDEGWKINLQKRIEEAKEEARQASIEIPIDAELLETAQKYKDKIEIIELRNGEVDFGNGITQYMMDATIKNNSDQHFSYVGALVKFMDEEEKNVLFEKTFFLIYTRVIDEIYPIAPGEQRDIIIPGYDAGDIDGRWTGKLQWEVYAVKLATPGELIKLEDLDLPK